MAKASPALTGMAWLRPGVAVQAWCGRALHHQGVVEQLMPEANVLWIREDVLGARKMIDLEHYVLRPR